MLIKQTARASGILAQENAILVALQCFRLAQMATFDLVSQFLDRKKPAHPVMIPSDVWFP